MFRTLTLLTLLCFGLVPLSAQAQTLSEKPKLTTLHRFDDNYGSSPASSLTLGTDGNFYGVTGYGLSSSNIVFRMTPAGQLTTLHRFHGPDGAQPSGSLLQGKDGAFYGVTDGGGVNGIGTVYRITASGQFSTLYSFTYKTGSHPAGKLAQDADGNLYGVGSEGGAGYDKGVVFRLTPAGTFTMLHKFIVTDGKYPEGGITLGPDGNLYGTASQAGAVKGGGTLFRLSTNGASFSVLHFFSTVNGASPYSGLTLGPDGALYGAALGGGVSNKGVLYKITTSGVYTILHAFTTDGHGTYPFAELTRGADGNFYGTTEFGGTDETSGNFTGRGTVFQMTPAGQVTTLYKFHTAFDGSELNAGVVFGPNGLLYGATYGGGSKGFGTLYSLSVPAAN